MASRQERHRTGESAAKATVPELFIEPRPARGHAKRKAATVEADTQTVGHLRIVGLATLLLIAVAAFGIQRLPRDTFPIREIRVAGEFRHLQPNAIQTLVGAAIDGGFFHVDVNTIRSRIMREPWIREVSIRRVWPAGLEVVIREQDAIARWGDDALLNSDGVVFRPADIDAGASMVRLEGPAGFELEVLSRYREFARAFAGIGLSIADLTLSDRRAWRLTTGDGVQIILGRKQADARLQRFVHVYPEVLSADWRDIGSVDMRYTNGMAVRTRADLELQQSAASPPASMPSAATHGDSKHAEENG